jgi:glycogen synthase
MEQDFSWKRSAQEYVKLYEKAMGNKRDYDSRSRAG